MQINLTFCACMCISVHVTNAVGGGVDWGRRGITSRPTDGVRD